MASADKVKMRLAGTDGIEDGAEDTVNQLTDIPWVITLAADGATSTAIAITKSFTNPFDFTLKVVSVGVSAGAGVTADATNNATTVISTDNGADSAPATAAQLVTDVAGGNWVTDILKAFTLTPANCLLPPGGNLFYTQTKAASGVQLPVRNIVVRMRRV